MREVFAHAQEAMASKGRAQRYLFHDMVYVSDWNCSWHVQGVQGGEVAGRPIGLIAYLIMGYAATFLAYTWAESMRLGFAIYGIFDFTSTYMYDGWFIKVCS